MEQEIEASQAEDGAALAKRGQRWLERISAAQKREDDWQQDAKAAEKAYSCDAKAEQGKVYDFNILHSNVETIVPAIYNSTPVPDVRRRWTAPVEMPKPPQAQQGQQPNPQQVAAFQAQMQQVQAIAAADKAAKDFGDLVERAITVQIDDNKLDAEVEKVAQDAFLSGRGIIRIAFEATFQTVEVQMPDGSIVEQDKATGEEITFQAWSWRDFAMGQAKRWSDVPWIAFRHSMDREAVEEFQDAEMLASQPAAPATSDGDDECDVGMWEVWDRKSRAVVFIRADDGRVLKIEDDPLGLPGFFPVPEIVQPITLTGKMTPVCPFTVYKKLADELDLCTRRIAAIMKGLKVRGGVMGNAKDIENIAKADDNELVPIADVEQLAQTGGMDKAIVWWPIEKAIVVLQQLYVQRDVIKAAIYEITGISDIVRGASNANETLGAQQIKTQWGSLRIQKMQRMIERLVRNVFSMMADVIVSKFSPETLQKMTGLQVTPDMMALMQEPVSSSYRVDVESDSTVRADLSRIKGEMAEFLQGTAQFFSTMGPLIQQVPAMAEPMSEIYSAFVRVFRLGKQAEDAIDRMTAQAKEQAGQQKPNPEAEAAKAKMQIETQKLQVEFEKAKAELGIKQAELQLKQAELQLKAREMQQEGALRAAELQIEATRPAPVSAGLTGAAA